MQEALVPMHQPSYRYFAIVSHSISLFHCALSISTPKRYYALHNLKSLGAAMEVLLAHVYTSQNHSLHFVL